MFSLAKENSVGFRDTQAVPYQLASRPMPGAQTQQVNGDTKLPSVVFWTGMGLTPLAAVLVFLTEGSSSARIAAAVAILGVALVGLSVMLRPDARSAGADLEALVAEEIEVLRQDVRQDITSAVQASHANLAERLALLRQQLDAALSQLDAARIAYPPPVAKIPAGVAAPVAAAAVGRSGGAGHAPVPSRGVVKHTETVQVTRQTIVDRQDDAERNGYPERGASRHPVAPRRVEPEYADRSRGRDGYADRGREAEPSWDSPSREESWTDQKLRERFGNPAGTAGRAESASPAEPGRWSGVRSGDRWAAVHSDEHGRELHLGERRAAVHSDGSGTSVRIEDRWAAVRREEARREEPRRDEPRRDEPRWTDAWRTPSAESRGTSNGWSAEQRAHERDHAVPWTDTTWERRGPAPAPAALPAAPAEAAPAWTRAWADEPRRQPVGERVSERWRREDGPRTDTGSHRRIEFDLSDERWR